MWAEGNWLCVMDITNTQRDYAHTLDLIEAFERLASDADEAAPPTELLPLRITYVPRGAANAAKQLSTVEQLIAEDTAGRVRTINSWEQILEGTRRSSDRRGFSYYIRIDLQPDDRETDLTDLRYLGLLIQTVPAAQEKIAVFFCNSLNTQEEQAKYYLRLSSFLRLFQMRYGSFYAKFNLNDIQPISKKHTGTQQTFFPLTEINRDSYELLTRRRKAGGTYGEQDYSELYQVLHLESETPDEDDSGLNALFHIGIRFFFSALDGRKYGKPKKRRGCLSN